MAYSRNGARRRARRPSRRRELHTGVLGRLLIMAAVVAAIVLGVAIFFRVRTVEVQGNSIYSWEQVANASGVAPGDNLFMLNREAVAGSIKAQLPYVQNVSVGRILPDTVVIQVEESQIAGLVEADVGGSWYINTEGRVLGSSLDNFSGQVVEMTGFTLVNPQTGQDARPTEGQEEAMAAALEIIDAMEGTGLMEKITTINVEKTYDIELLAGDQYQILLGGTDELPYKMQYLQAVLDELDPYLRGTIDLTFDEKRVARFREWEQTE
ncbi:MAG TPA: FtsQ-type POTRA domain-containing protein [Candidatus Avoscillospira avicola]|uniref:FtsQ-type POTRA domain-containing protein n=1 Tax=Candidatus Avoscillospira avicola TaxID=2840706 RepID=A0A9D1DJ27_9FIRM|nr:FtsQ-type POTRA domain-containing protein [Candidatus Avoscillospira avicola]